MSKNDKTYNNSYALGRRVQVYPSMPTRNRLRASVEVIGASESQIVQDAIDQYFKSLPRDVQERINAKALAYTQQPSL